MTWSARPNSDGGTVRSNAFASLRLMTRSNVVGRSMGKVAWLRTRGDLIAAASSHLAGQPSSQCPLRQASPCGVSRMAGQGHEEYTVEDDHASPPQIGWLSYRRTFGIGRIAWSSRPDGPTPRGVA
jgi:hypothetical protein